VLIGWCFPDLLTKAPKLRWVHHLTVGIDACNMSPAFVDAPFLISNNKRNTGPAMAEHGMAMLLMLTRNLQHFRDQQNEQLWLRKPGTSPMIEISGKTMLVVGLGGIGTEVARRASALGMRVIATRNSSREGPEYVDYVGLADELLTLSRQAQVVVNTLPLTKQTLGIFNAEFFASLPKNSYFISLGRGKHTNTEALLTALENGTLAGAGLDVTDPEPLPKDHKLWAMKNVIITPHISSATDSDTSMRWIVARENLRRYIRGEPLLNEVDKQKGY
jgi:phosphoglycerate dehydrogenase-like enzyme